MFQLIILEYILKKELTTPNHLSLPELTGLKAAKINYHQLRLAFPPLIHTQQTRESRSTLDVPNIYLVCTFLREKVDTW